MSSNVPKNTAQDSIIISFKNSPNHHCYTCFWIASTKCSKKFLIKYAKISYNVLKYCSYHVQVRERERERERVTRCIMCVYSRSHPNGLSVSPGIGSYEWFAFLRPRPEPLPRRGVLGESTPRVCTHVYTWNIINEQCCSNMSNFTTKNFKWNNPMCTLNNLNHFLYIS